MSLRADAPSVRRRAKASALSFAPSGSPRNWMARKAKTFFKRRTGEDRLSLRCQLNSASRLEKAEC